MAHEQPTVSVFAPVLYLTVTIERALMIDRLVDAGARAVVLSREDRPALARFGGKTMQAVPPSLEPADTRGAGDSMTAGLTAAIRRGLDPGRSLRLASAAAAANITRRGLGSASESLVPELEERVEVSTVDIAPR